MAPPAASDPDSIEPDEIVFKPLEERPAKKLKKEPEGVSDPFLPLVFNAYVSSIFHTDAFIFIFWNL